MTSDSRLRLAVIALFVTVVALCAAGIWRYGYGQALDQLEKQGRADLALASDRFTGQLRRYQELAVLMADHPTLARVSAGRDAQAARALLLEAADKTGAMGLAYVDASGRILAQAGNAPRDPAQIPAFTRAINGALGVGYGRLGARGGRAYIYAAPAFAADGLVRGALIVLVDIAELEWDWIGGQPPVFFTEEKDEIFVSNRSELLFWRARDDGPGYSPANAPAPDFTTHDIAGHEVWKIDWGDYLPKRALHLTQDLPVIDMTGHVLINVAPARRLAALQSLMFAVICLAFGAVILQITERRRTLARANAQLEQRVTERTGELTVTNRALRREIRERLEAEAALKKAQDDLVQAGKLSALGQISAGISHELNQPLMAIRQYADNGAQFLDRAKPEKAGENLTRISALAARMARIIRNLRAFAKQESEPVARVDIVTVIEQVLELSEARLEADGVTVHWAPPQAPVYVMGGEVRLGQVLINLISNAADAMSHSPTKEISITVTPGNPVVVEVQDTGPGIDEPEKIFDPFYSTKEVGSTEGMGLGLSISYGLVQSFGGDIKGRNTPQGGAAFRIELEAALETPPAQEAAE
ncbi:ATP-binding protein [Roseovarius sp. MMSF_3281]|uniref:sensor histidine kinase n=1 Tax=Roseovarius sp. MMSF_3281 TaxID=3046694 RepID=UPI00273E7254|nr:ATP-binding protein [Roseovarius sp. MMSF_3281]